MARSCLRGRCTGRRSRTRGGGEGWTVARGMKKLRNAMGCRAGSFGTAGFEYNGPHSGPLFRCTHPREPVSSAVIRKYPTENTSSSWVLKTHHIHNVA